MRARNFMAGLIVAGVCLGAVPVLAAPPAAGGAGSQDQPAVSSETEDDLVISREHYFYSSFARRDPFASLLKGRFSSTGEGDLLDIGELILVGVIWGGNEKFAVVEDKRGNVHTLREGDRVVNGKVIKITRTDLTVQHYFFGETANVTIQINEGEGANETR